jgi:hypothetical protein
MLGMELASRVPTSRTRETRSIPSFFFLCVWEGGREGKDGGKKKKKKRKEKK